MANEQRINDIIDIAAITKQVEATEQQLGRIVATIAEINKSGVTFKAPSGGGIPEATKQIDELGRATQKLSNLQTEAGKAAYQNIQATKELTKAQQLQAQAANEQAGAYSKLMAQTQLANKAARDMAAQYGTNSKQFKDAAQKANELNTKLKDIDAEINIHNKNVGNYGGAIGSLRQEIKNLTQTLATMEMQGKNNSKEYKTMVMRLGELKDAVGDVQARSKFFADDARYINTAVQAVQGLVGAYSVYVGVTELVGEKNEELEKIMRKMMALMTVMQGMQQVANMLNKDSYVRVAAQVALDKLKVYWQGVSVVTTNAETGATKKATAAQIAYNIAKKAAAGIVGIIIVAVSALAVAYYKYRDSLLESTKEQKLNTEIQKKAIDGYAEQTAQITLYSNVLKDSTASTYDKKKAIEDLDKVMGTNLSSFKDQNKAIVMAIALSDLYIIKLKAQAEAEAAKELYVEATKEKLKAEKSAIQDNIKWYEKLVSYFGMPSLQHYGMVAGANRLNETIEDASEKSAEFSDMYIKKTEESNKATQAFIDKAKELGVSLTDNTEVKGKNIKATIKYAEGIERIQKILPKQVDVTASYYEKLQELNKELQTGLITQKEYNTAYSELNGVYIEAIDNTEKFTKAQMDLFNEIRAAKSENLNKLYEEVPKLAGEGLNLIQSYSDIMSENNDNELKEYEKLQDEKLRILNERLNLGLITEAQYTAQKSNLDIEYDKKKEELEKKEFKRKKALAIAEAVINAAAGVIKALGEGSVFGIIQAGIIAAMAGLEIAKISAQYPAYAKGRKDGPGEYAVVGEQGWEYRGDHTGIFKTPNTSTLTYLKPHEWVMPHNESVQLEKSLKMPGVIIPGAVKEQKQNDDILNELKRLNKKPTAVINMDKDGIRAALAQGANTMNFINNHILFKN